MITDEMFSGISRVGTNNSSRTAQELRDHFANYFLEVGAVGWQHDSVTRGTIRA